MKNRFARMVFGGRKIIKTMVMAVTTLSLVASISRADAVEQRVYQNECLTRLMSYCRKGTRDRELFKKAAELTRNCSNWNAVFAVSRLTSFCSYGVEGHITHDNNSGPYSEEHRNTNYGFKFYTSTSQLSIKAVELATKVQNSFQLNCFSKIVDRTIQLSGLHAGEIENPLERNNMVPSGDFEICLQ